MSDIKFMAVIYFYIGVNVWPIFISQKSGSGFTSFAALNGIEN